MEDADDLLARFQPQADQVINEFQEFVFTNFDEMDKNKDGFLSREELLAALCDKKRSVRELAFLNFLLVRIREIAASYQEEWADKPDCISKPDLREYFSKLAADRSM